MKICHVYKSYAPETIGGCEQFIQILCHHTQTLGIENHLITTTSKNYSIQENTHNAHLSRFSQTLHLASCPISLSLWRNFARVTQDVDLIHYHAPWPFADWLNLWHASDTPYIVTYHSDIVKQRFLKQLHKPFLLRFLRGARAIATTSERLKQSSPTLRQFQNKVHVIAHGLDPEDYASIPADRLHYWQQRLPNRFGLFIGVLRHYKGIPNLLRALQGSQERVVIAGTGPLQRKLERLAQRLHLHNVIFLGEVSDIDKNCLLQLCRYVVIPSSLRSEAYCLALVEGLLFGKPLLSCEIGTGTSFVNRDGETGIIVLPDDIQALRQAIETLSTDDALMQHFQLGARHHFAQHFHASRTAHAYAELYATSLEAYSIHASVENL